MEFKNPWPESGKKEDIPESPYEKDIKLPVLSDIPKNAERFLATAEKSEEKGKLEDALRMAKFAWYDIGNIMFYYTSKWRKKYIQLS